MWLDYGLQIHIYNPRLNVVKNQNDDVSSDFLFVSSVKVSNRVRLFRRRALEALPATGFHWREDFEECVLLQFPLWTPLAILCMSICPPITSTLRNLRRGQEWGGRGHNFPWEELSHNENCLIWDQFDIHLFQTWRWLGTVFNRPETELDIYWCDECTSIVNVNQPNAEVITDKNIGWFWKTSGVQFLVCAQLVGDTAVLACCLGTCSLLHLLAREGNKENVKISAQCQNPRNEFPGSLDNAAIFSRDSDTRGILPQPAFSLLIVAQHHYSGLVIVLVICHLIIIIPPQKHSSLDHYSLLLLTLLPNKGLRMRNC